MSAIICNELSKAYSKGDTALDSLTITIPRGMSFGLLGENGAGKSTLVKLIMGFIFPTSGELRVFGESEVARAHNRIGYVHERPIFEPRFRGDRYLTYLGNLSELWGQALQQRMTEALALVGLADAAHRLIGTYSKGMLQRLAIAQALLANPDLLILDEPTSGLDPSSQFEVRQIIATLRAQGKTILLCSHYLAEVEALCDTIGILSHGQLILHGRISELVQAQDIVEIALADGQSAADVVRRLGITGTIIATHGHMLRLAHAQQSTVLSALVRADIDIATLTPLSTTLESVYVQATQTANDAERSHA